MAEAPGGYQGVVLPNLFESPGQAMNQQIALQERERERNAQFAFQENERRQRQQQQNRLWNLNQLNEQTSFDRFKTGQQRLDDYVMGELGKIKQNALSSYINLDPAEMQYRLTQDMQNLSQWDAAAKTGYKNLEGTLDDFTKQIKNVDATKARSLLENQFISDVMQTDENGNIVRKNPQEIKFGDYGALLTSPQAAAQLITGISPITDYLEKSATQDISPKYKKEVKGKYTIENYKGKINPSLQEVSGLPDKEGYLQGTPQVNFKSEKHGNVDAMPKDVFDETFMSDPARAYTFNGAWQRQKDAIEQSSGMKIPDGSPQDDVLKRAFALQIAKRHVPAMLNPDIQQTQAPFLTRIELGYPPNSGKGNGENENINDVYGTIDAQINKDISHGYTSTRINALPAEAQNEVLNFVKNTTGDSENNYSNLFLHKNENGEIGIYKTSTSDENSHIAEGKQGNVPDARHLIGYLTQTGTNLKATQPGAAEKRGVIQKGNQTTTPHTSGKKKTANDYGIN